MKFLILFLIPLISFGAPVKNKFLDLAKAQNKNPAPQGLDTDGKFPSTRIIKQGFTTVDEGGSYSEVKLAEAERQRQAYVARPMAEIRGIAESEKLVELIKKMSDTKLSQTMIALNQTEPSLSDAVQHTNQLSSDYYNTIAQGDERFRRLIEQYPSLANIYLPAYEGCISKKMGDGQMSWTTAVLQCSGDKGLEGGKPLEFATGDMFDLTTNPDTKTKTAKSYDTVDTIFNKLKFQDGSEAEYKKSWIEIFGNVIVTHENKGNGTFTVKTTRKQPEKTLAKFAEEMELEVGEKLLLVMKNYCKFLNEAAAPSEDPGERDFFKKKVSPQDRLTISLIGDEINIKLVDAMYKAVVAKRDDYVRKKSCDLEVFDMNKLKETGVGQIGIDISGVYKPEFQKFAHQFNMFKAYITLVVSSRLNAMYSTAYDLLQNFPVVDPVDDILKEEAILMIQEVVGKQDFAISSEAINNQYVEFVKEVERVAAKNSGKGGSNVLDAVNRGLAGSLGGN